MRIYLEVYGCTANKSDAALIKGILKENNYEIVETIDESDIIILLTCTVIDTTEQRMLSRLKEFKKRGKQVIVTGCMASVQKDRVKTVLPDARFLPPQFTSDIINIIEDKQIRDKEESKAGLSKYYDDIFAPISISEGCLFSCSYCITCLARGKLRSFPIKDIKKDVDFAVKNGCKEIQLTAQDTSSYGLDKKDNLGELLKSVTNVKREYRIRVGMMNPYTALKNLDSIISAFQDPKIYTFVHLPVQSGDNEILKKMNRKYTVEDFRNLVDEFRSKIKDVTLSTDVIVGFPGETEEQFENTIDLLKEVKPDITNITRFSARPYTKAKKMDRRIKTETVKSRSKILTNLCRDISENNNKAHVGKKYSILITELGKNNTLVGRSQNYKPVVIKENVEIGEILDVQITKSAPTYLVGSLI